jgi:hypothetical protein
VRAYLKFDELLEQPDEGSLDCKKEVVPGTNGGHLKKR